MNEKAMLDTRQIHSMSDFLRNHKAHVARLKETGTPEVLTINGSAAVVVQDAESYQDLLDRLHHMEAVSSVRAAIRAADRNAPKEEVSEAEIERSQAVVRELMAETERLGLYK